MAVFTLEGIIAADIDTKNARDFKESIVDEIENSNFSPTVIAACRNAGNNKYTVTVNEYKDSELYFDVKNYVFYFIEDLYMKPSDLLINLQINLGKKYKKNKEAYALFLNLLVLGMRDMFHVKHSIPILFVKHKDFFEKMPEDGKILQKIEIILEYAERLNNNVNLALLLDGMVYKVLKGV